MLWLALCFPLLPLETGTRSQEAAWPVVVASSAQGSATVVACNARARAAGIHPGLGVSAAWALAPCLHVLARNEATERAALERIAAATLAFTPLASTTPPAAVLLEIAGSLHLFGGLAPLKAAVTALAADLGYTLRLGCAPTPLAAEWLARTAAPDVTHARDLEAALAPLPLAVLDAPGDVAATLDGIGIRTIGEFARLPREATARRFGPPLVEALDRALGRRPDPRAPYAPPAAFESKLDLPAPVAETQALLFAARRLIGEFAAWLAGTGRGALRFRFDLAHDDGPDTPVTIGLAAPGRDPAHLALVTRERFERLALDRPVETLALASDELQPLASQNLAFFPDAAHAAENAARLVERLRARLGEDAVRGLTLVPDHRPERAWRFSAPGAATRDAAAPARPLWLLSEPRPLALDTDGPRLGGALALLPDCERIESGWWDGAGIARDYFVAEDTAGARYWVYRERASGQWLLHGVFG